MEETLGMRIAANRKRLGLTQYQLAEKLGVSPQAVSKWENDLSCPDIATLPRLADLFGISLDALLGREEAQVVHQAEVVDQADDVHFEKGHWEFSWDAGRRNGIIFALFVLLVGALTLADTVFDWKVSFGGILWPSALLMLGVRQILERFTFFSLGCTLLGGYFLLENLEVIHLQLGFNLLLPIALLLFGFSLLADALRKKNRKPSVHIHHNGKQKNESSAFTENEDAFNCETSFGAHRHLINLNRLREGNAECNFGELVVDLSGVCGLTAPCTINADCSFGELTLLVPRHFAVDPDSHTAFGAFHVEGEPADPVGTIHLNASANFGEIKVCYI